MYCRLWLLVSASEIDIYNLCCVIVSGVVGRAGAVAVGAGLRSRPENREQKKYILTDIKKSTH